MIAGLPLFAPLLDAPFFRDLEQRVRAGALGIALQGLVEGGARWC